MELIKMLIAIAISSVIICGSLAMWGILLVKLYKWYNTLKEYLINNQGKGREGCSQNAGEKSVTRYLEQLNQPKHIINNIYINDNGKSRQIDHILIVEQGIFVIETKNYSGTIYGKEKWNEWKQYLGNRKFEFKNPIHQNYGHVQIVRKTLGIEEDKKAVVKSLVVFTNKSNLKVEAITLVIHEREIPKLLTLLPKKLTLEQMQNAYNIIMSNRITNEETITNHNYNVTQYVKYKEELLNNEICPRCHSKLIRRSGRYGEFLGCSNYPNCKFNKKIEAIKR